MPHRRSGREREVGGGDVQAQAVPALSGDDAREERMSTENKKLNLATVWLDGCSGCHMSFLDIDERIIELADRVNLVYSPLVDIKEFPENVDVALIEGAVAS